MHIYLFSPIPYSFLHQRPQKLADKFVAAGHSVTYIEPRGITEYLTGTRKGLARMALVSVGYHILAVISMVVVTLRRKPKPRPVSPAAGAWCRIIPMPLIIPSNRVDSAVIDRMNAAVYRQVLRRVVFRTMAPSELNVAIVQNPFWGLVLAKGDFSPICYDCIDEISLYAGRASVARFQSYENRLLSISDLVFTTARRLEESVRSRRPGVDLYRIPNGVDYQWFQERIAQGPGTPDLGGAHKPIVGYAGVLRNWMDYELIGLLAREIPDASFVLVGPLDYEHRIKDLRTYSNVYWLGRKNYDEIPLFINSFDVCIIPFQQGKVAQTTNPVKLYEYFALGKPVVSTWLAELEGVRDRSLVYMVDSREDFVNAVREALQENDPSRSQERRKVAAGHSWSTLAAQMVSAIVSRQGRPDHESP